MGITMCLQGSLSPESMKMCEWAFLYTLCGILPGSTTAKDLDIEIGRP